MRRGGISSAADPHLLTEYRTAFAGPGYRAIDGKVASTPRVSVGENVGVFVVAGQSNAASYATGPYTILNPTTLDMVSPYDGGTYQVSEPVLGANVGTAPANTNLFVRAFDSLISDGVYDRIIACFVAVNGSTISLWAPGGVLNSRLLVAPKRLAAVNLNVTAFLWMQGETDGTSGTSEAAYSSYLADVIGTPRAAGFDAPWLVGKATYANGNVFPDIQAAQDAAVNGTDIFAGADTDTLTGTSVYRQASNTTHFTSAGADAAAALWASAITAAL